MVPAEISWRRVLCVRSVLLSFASLLVAVTPALSHPSDVSQMRVELEPQSVEVRLTMNLLTLTQITGIDTDHNRRITPAEVATAVPLIAEFLRQKMPVTVNDHRTAGLGDFQRYECVWPNAGIDEVTDQEASERHVDFHFRLRWPAGVKEWWLGFQFFEQLGSLHTVQAVYQQEGSPDLPVEFSQSQPEYLYATGWKEADFIKANAKSREFHPWALALGILAVLVSLLAWLRNARRSAR